MNAIAQVSAAPVSGPKLDNRRVAAAIIDLLVVSVGAVAILVAGDSLSGDRQGALSAVILGWALYYFFALESGEGQTLGKKLMKLRVVRADGRPAGMREIAVRTILRVIDNYLVGLIVMLATGDRRQRIGDLAAGTIVVDASGPAVASPPPPAVADTDADAEVDGAGTEADGEADGDAGDDVADDAADDAEAAAADEPVAKTITLPARPAPPATLADLTEPVEEPAGEEEPAVEAEPVPVAAEEPVTEEPVVEVEPVPVAAEEPVTEEPLVEVEPVEEPVVELEAVEEPVVEAEPVEEPVVEAEPVAEVEAVEEPVVEDEAELPSVSSPAIEELAHDVAAAQVEPAVEDEPVEDEPVDDEQVNVKSVQTVSAIDLVMGGAEEQAAEGGPESAQDPEHPASA